MFDFLKRILFDDYESQHVKFERFRSEYELNLYRRRQFCIRCEVPRDPDGKIHFCGALQKPLFCKYDRQKGVSCLDRTIEFKKSQSDKKTPKFEDYK